MREIEFRGVCLDTNKIVYGHFLIDRIGNYRIYSNNFYDYHKSNFHFIRPETLGQYTGKKDKYNRKIFECDFGLRKFDLKPMVCRYDSLLAGFFWFDYDDAVIAFELDCTIEIIGNIYENPELLEGK